MSEHNGLKKYAREILEKQGFKPEEIFEEYTVKTGEARSSLRVDIVGISKTRKIAIECGHCDAKKLPQLDLFFDEVIHLPYLKNKITHGESVVLKAKEEEISRLIEQIEQLQSEVSYLKKQGSTGINLKDMAELARYRLLFPQIYEGLDEARKTLRGEDAKIAEANPTDEELKPIARKIANFIIERFEN